MGTGFEVTPRALKRSATSIQPLGGRIAALGGQVMSSAGSAAAANPSYLTSAAANQVAAEINRAMATLGEALVAHAGGLGNCSATYTSTEKRCVWMFNRVRNGVPQGATYA